MLIQYLPFLFSHKEENPMWEIQTPSDPHHFLDPVDKHALTTGEKVNSA